MENIDWNSTVVGKFFGPNPPDKSLVQQIVVSRWLKRGTITVHNTPNSPYYIFICSNSTDVEALLEQHTSVIDGRIITFRTGKSGNPSFETINFDIAKLWVRVCDLPLCMLHPSCGRHLLNVVGVVEKVANEEEGDDGFPKDVELRGKVHVDLFKPLIPGCYVPLDEGKVTWVQFRYEGVFMLCEKCGLVGHNRCDCQLTNSEAAKQVYGQMDGFKEEGGTVIQDTTVPLYSNLIEGLPNRYRNRNTRVNLLNLGLGNGGHGNN